MTVALVTTVQRYLGLSSDTKPTIGVSAGSIYVETNTSDRYAYNGSAWSLVGSDM